MNFDNNRYKNPESAAWPNLLKRPSDESGKLEGTVSKVFQKIQQNGDAALREYTREFDQVYLNSFLVSETEFQTASLMVLPELKKAILLAKENIEKFHSAQKTVKVKIETSKGVKCWQEKKPIQKVGLYIPGGTAPLFSTILMLAVPAKIAGCEEIIICSPPDKSGELHYAVLYTAQLCGITKVFKIGGIQAIAAMTYGTESIPKVYKIFGPGNQYVTAAKQYAFKEGISIDLPAGPSELLIVADDSADPSFIAADLLSQAEHGLDSQVVLVSISEELISKVEAQISIQLELLPRKQIAEAALKNSRFIFFENKTIALEFINEYAPEHFIICTHNTDFYSNGIQNAGSVFIGNYSPESAGDYASGTNHTLPTNGAAKQYSGVNLDSFQKSITFQEISREGIQNIGPAIELLAETEGLLGHSNAVKLRLNKLNETNEK